MAKVRSIKKSKKRRAKTRNKILAIFVLALVILIWMSQDTIKMVQAKRQNASLKRELANIEKKNRNLDKQIKNLKRKEYIKLEAKRQLGYVEQGEKAYVVIKKEVKPEKKKAPKELSWWESTVNSIKELF